MDKEVGYIYTREYYSAIKRNAFESVLMRTDCIIGSRFIYLITTDSKAFIIMVE